MPDFSILNDNEVAQLKDTINELRSQLDSAHNEVQNLLTENHILQKIIKDQQNKINQLTTICTSNKKQPRKVNRSNNVAKKIDFSEKTVSLTTIKNCPATSLTYNQPCENHYEVKSVETSASCCSSKENIDISTTKNTSSKSQDTLPSTNQTKSETDSVPNQGSKTDSVTKRRLLIFGAQLCSKLASRLIKLRYNTKYEHYDIYGCIKPFATTEEID
ncbi:unnamed protein product [Parnassius apollo]|uniref:(apollo) hypothetical protein n=1 Tax=Parnassius apollo TaxID=110799 RepID=A0A8S3Y6E0_PARAO|nr:unnamed protein product [Parnassius apollo]